MSKLLQCDHCDELVESLDNGWCAKCANAYDGPSDDELSSFYGGGGTRPIAEQYREAAEEKRGLRR